jgi:hypothetical protein
VEIEDSRQTIRQASEVILEQRLQIAFLSMALALFEREQPDSQSTYETGPLEEAPLQL